MHSPNTDTAEHSPMYAQHTCTPRRRHLAIHRRGRVLSRLRLARLFCALLGSAGLPDVHARNTIAQGKGKRRRSGRRVSPILAGHGQCRRGRRRQALCIVRLMIHSLQTTGLDLRRFCSFTRKVLSLVYCDRAIDQDSYVVTV